MAKTTELNHSNSLSNSGGQPGQLNMLVTLKSWPGSLPCMGIIYACSLPEIIFVTWVSVVYGQCSCMSFYMRSLPAFLPSVTKQPIFRVSHHVNVKHEALHA